MQTPYYTFRITTAMTDDIVHTSLVSKPYNADVGFMKILNTIVATVKSVRFEDLLNFLVLLPKQQILQTSDVWKIAVV